MPEPAVREMVADWMAATRTHDGVWVKDLINWEWYKKAWPNIQPFLHDDTVVHIHTVFREIGLVTQDWDPEHQTQRWQMAELIAAASTGDQVPRATHECSCGTIWNPAFFDESDNCPDCGRHIDED